MDYDDLDYFPRKHVPTRPAKEQRGELTKAQNLTWLAANRNRPDVLALNPTTVRNEDVVTVRVKGHAIDFQTRSNRWQYRSTKAVLNGTIGQFFDYCTAHAAQS